MNNRPPRADGNRQPYENSPTAAAKPRGGFAISWPMFWLILFRITRSIAGGMMIVAMPYLVLNTLHDSSLTLGILYVAGVMSTAMLSLAAGHLCDRWSQKGTLLITGLMVPAGAMMVWANHSFPVLLAAAVVAGFAATGSLIGGGVGGVIQPVQSAIIARITTPENRTHHYSILPFFSGIAGAAGAMLVPIFSINESFLAAALISLAGLIPVLQMRIPKPDVSPENATVTHRESRKAIMHFSITGALNGLSQGLLTPFLIPFFVTVYRMPKSNMAVYTAIGSALGAVALLTAPALEKRLGFVQSVTFTRALGTILLLVMALWHNLPVGLLIYILTPALRIAALPAQQTAMINRVEGNSMGRALAANQVTRLSATSGAMLCTGYLFDMSAIEAPFMLYALVMGVNIYLYYRFFGRHGHMPAPRGQPVEAAADVDDRSRSVDTENPNSPE